jgi:hypothetical protein
VVAKVFYSAHHAAVTSALLEDLSSIEDSLETLVHQRHDNYEVNSAKNFLASITFEPVITLVLWNKLYQVLYVALQMLPCIPNFKNLSWWVSDSQGSEMRCFSLESEVVVSDTLERNAHSINPLNWINLRCSRVFTTQYDQGKTCT